MADQPKTDRSVWIWRLLPVVLIAAVAVVLFVRYRQSAARGPAALPPTDVTDQTPTEAEPPDPLRQAWSEAVGSPAAWPTDFGEPADCSAALDKLRMICGKLEERPYVGGWSLEQGLFAMVIDGAGALAARPPAVTGLLRDLELLRSNVTHLFRVLGPERLTRVLQVLDEEPELAEPVALTLYQWLSAGERCDEPAGRPPSADAQSDYAAFLLESLGGHGYLRRRSPRIEALATFYAVLIADRAIGRGYNPHGLDLRPHIARAQALVAGQSFVFADRYLEQLGRLEQSWKDGAPLR